MMKTVWRVEHETGQAADFHERDLPELIEPSLIWFEVERSALVLGSAQPVGDIDELACSRAGVDIVRRRSGGGAVLLEPDDCLWLDVLIPAAHALWTPDVTSSMWWLGDVWRAALSSLGMADLEVHRGPMRHTVWSKRVCFAGTGGGEVMLGDRKVVGISQRRTRAGARMQCAVYRNWRAEAHAALFAQPGPTADDLADLVATVRWPFADVRSAVLDAFSQLG